MKMNTKFKAIGTLLAATVFSTSCKLVITVPENGRVVSSSGAYNCGPGETCEFDVVDVSFDETFFAFPTDETAAFNEWATSKGDQTYFCGGTKDPCQLSTTQFRGSEVLMGFLESDEKFHLSPRFVDPNNSRFPKVEITGTWDYSWTRFFQNIECRGSGSVIMRVDSDNIWTSEYLAGGTVPDIELTPGFQCRILNISEVITGEVVPLSAPEPLNEFQIQDDFNAYLASNYGVPEGPYTYVEVFSRSHFKMTFPFFDAPTVIEYKRTGRAPPVSTP